MFRFHAKVVSYPKRFFSNVNREHACRARPMTISDLHNFPSFKASFVQNPMFNFQLALNKMSLINDFTKKKWKKRKRKPLIIVTQLNKRFKALVVVPRGCTVHYTIHYERGEQMKKNNILRIFIFSSLIVDGLKVS